MNAPIRLQRVTKMLDIILVEDDDGDAKATRRALERAKVANPIRRMHDGVEALDYLKGRTSEPVPEKFIMLLDINMPRMNGLELLSEIRADPKLRSAVVFMLTTSEDERDVAAAYDQNVSGYIVKSRVGPMFVDLVTALSHYWRIVELPDLPGRGPAL